MRYLITCLILLPLFSIAQERSLLGIDGARWELKQALKDSSIKPSYVKKIINDKQTAIDISEAILFKVYGKKNVISQRPYEVYLIDDYWFLRGTLPAPVTHGKITTAVSGGTFLIILSSEDGRVIKLDHGE